MRARITSSSWSFGLLLLLLARASLPSPAPGAPSLRIGIAPEQNVFRQVERFAPLFRELERSAGVVIVPRLSASYGQLLEELQDRRLDGVFAGSFVVASWIEHGTAQPVARIVHRRGGSSYRGLILARRDRGVTSIDELRGGSIAFVDPATTAGYVFPLAWLAEQGVDDVDAFFDDWYFAGSHDAVIRAVLQGRADVGAAKDTVFARMAAIEARVEQDLVVLARSAPVPALTLAVATTVDARVTRGLRRALLELDRSEEGREILEDLDADHFERAAPSDYRAVLGLISSARPLTLKVGAE